MSLKGDPNNGPHAVMWGGSSQSVIDLHPGGGWYSSSAYGIGGGQEVGGGQQYILSNGSLAVSNFYNALLWSGAGLLANLSPSNFSSSCATATDGKQQVGYAFNPGSAAHAILWSGSASSAVDLQPSSYTSSEALGVAPGQQVGQGVIDGVPHALLWTGSAQTAVDLNPAFSENSEALSTNGLLQVGYYTSNGVQNAALWSGTANSVVNLQSLLGGSYIRSTANSIDAQGNVFGLAVDSSGHYHAVEWTQGPSPSKAFLLNSGQTGLFTDQLKVVPISNPGVDQLFGPANVIGIVTQLSGNPIITLANGTTQPLTLNTPIHQGDVVITGNGDSANLEFRDQSNVNISPNSNLKMDDYIYDPNPDSGDYSLLRRLFTYTGNILGQVDPDDVEAHYPAGSIGIRGDASDFINIDPTTLHKAAEIMMGSPVKLYTAIPTPNANFTLKFQYGFFDPSQTLNITLDGKTVFSTTAAADGTGQLIDVAVVINDPALLDLPLAELDFNFDGDHGSQAMLTDVILPGLSNGDFANADANWFSSSTDGSVQWAAIELPEPSMTGLLLPLSFYLASRRRTNHYRFA